jgi:asparagine synthase (glutamine-hydrolysing)
MCGIAGILGGAGDPADAARVRAMVRIQAYRGPDGRRVEVLPGGVLGHNRLSIIDLSDRASQPMASADDRHVIVFNGEIYNYRELRRDLEAIGQRWRTDSDTEVLLASFRAWGEGCLDRLDGMFAFCILDTMDGTAFLARDRFGQKPLLFATRADGALLFASEAKALLAGGIVARPDRAVWGRYLAQASFDDTSETFFEGITQLEPGQCATFAPGRGLRARRWYDAGRIARRRISAADAEAELRALAIDAARLHMRSDVPVGVSLSGGFDSSALLACIHLADEIQPGLHCYSVDFPDYSERDWVEAAARHHGLNATIRTYQPDQFRASLSAMVWHLEGPVGGLMNSALAEVMQAARGDGVKVLQDGTGIDEAFAGYRNLHALHCGSAILAGDATSDAFLAEFAAHWGVTVTQARDEALKVASGPATAIDGTVPTRVDLLKPAWRHPSDRAARPTASDPLLQEQVAYLQVSKIPRNMRMKDRLSMAYGLELRLPFLDHRIVEYGLSLPPELLFLDGWSKSILRNALSGAMDEDVRTAVKRSVHTPQGPWLRRPPMADYVKALIESDSFAERGYFDVAAVGAAFGDFVAKGAANSFFVWQWINLEEWHRVFIDQDPVANPISLCPELLSSVVENHHA